MRSNLAVAFIVIVILGGASTILTARSTDVPNAGHEISSGEHK